MKKIKQLLQPGAKKASSSTNSLNSEFGDEKEEDIEGITVLSNEQVKEEILRATKDGYPACRVFWAGFKSVPGTCKK